MKKYFGPALAGLFLSAASIVAALPVAAAVASATDEPDFTRFSHDDALAYSQAAIGNTLEGVELINSDGQPVALEDYRGKTLVISMIFTSCHHICPTTTQHLDEVVSKARDVLGDDSFNVVTVGFDTVNDSPQRMASFRESIGVSDPHWDFLAGNEQQMKSLARQLGFIFTPSSRGFDHLIQSSIIDSQGKIYRQVYGITFPTPQLIEPLKDQVFGRPQSPSALDYLENRIRLFCTVYDPATDSYHIDVSVFIGTFVGLLVSIIFGRVLVIEWRRSLKAGR